MHLLMTAIATGLGVGAVYGMVGIGYTVIFNATRVFNLAQGDLLMVGVMLSYLSLDVAHLPQIVTLGVVLTGVVLLSLIEERLIVRRFLGRQHEGSSGLGWFIATLAFSLIVETVVINLYGNQEPRAIPSPLPQSGWQIGPASVSPQLAATVLGLLVLVALLELFQNRTWLGRGMRASAEDREGASFRGIRPNTISRAAFAIGGLASGVGAYMIGPIVLSDPTIGLNYTIKGFLALAIGGFGSIRGAVVGALALGVAEQVFDLYVGGSFEIVAGLILLFAVLACRPTGLFGSTKARAV